MSFHMVNGSVQEEAKIMVSQVKRLSITNLNGKSSILNLDVKLRSLPSDPQLERTGTLIVDVHAI